MLRQHRFLGAAAAALLFTLTGCVAPQPVNYDNSNPGYTGSHDQLPSGRPAPDYAASARINTELAGAYFSAGRYEVALEVAKRALAADPNSSVALGLQGLIYGELHDVPRADAAFRRAMEIDPANPDLQHNYGTFLCRNGKAEQSLGYFAKAVSYPTNARAANSYAAAGNCMLKLNRFQDAEAQLQLALQRDREHPEALLGMAELHYQQRQYPTALFDLQKLNQTQQPSAASLWMGVRIQRQLGSSSEQKALEAELARLYPKSDEAARLAAGQYD